MYYFCPLTTLPHVSFLNYFSPKGEWTHFRRQNGEYILYFLVEGEMYLREDGRDYVLKAGDLFLLQPGLVHEGTKAAECAYYFAHFSNLPLLPWSLPEEGEGAAFPSAYEGGGEAQFDMEHCLVPKHLSVQAEGVRSQLVACFEESMEKARTGAANYRVLWGCKLLEILTCYAEHARTLAREKNAAGLSARTMRKLGQLQDILQTRYREKLTGKDLESALGMNFDYLNRTFRKVTGRTIFQHLTRVRIQKAKELLTTTDMKLAEIALETGFNDEFYLSRQFKKHTGIPPAMYSKNGMKN